MVIVACFAQNLKLTSPVANVYLEVILAVSYFLQRCLFVALTALGAGTGVCDAESPDGSTTRMKRICELPKEEHVWQTRGPKIRLF